MGGMSRPPPLPLTDREGSHAGRGFRFQDAVAALQAIEAWAGKTSPSLVIPEGGDDIERRWVDGSALVQVKSRREHLGRLPLSDAARFVKKLWDRKAQHAADAGVYELILERAIAGCDATTTVEVSEALARALAADPRSGRLLERTRILVVEAPREKSISLVAGRAGCSPLAAELCVTRIIAKAGDLADANGRRVPADYLGLSPADVDAFVVGTLAAIDPEMLERAVRDGACEPVDFLTPLDDPDFYLGVDVQPGHVVAGLVGERPAGREAIADALPQRPVLVAGPSGAGKSALMWDAAHALRHTVRWYRLRRVDERDVPNIRQLFDTLRVGPASPVGLVVDDVGRRGADAWSALVRELAPVPGALLLGSIREEDLFLLAERARQIEVRVEPDEGLAERLWDELRAQDRTEWPGWREPWERSKGLTLEYVHILTAGRRFEEVLADQVAARERDDRRDLELDVLRIAACASSASATIDTAALAPVLGTADAAISRALHRLVDEHLVREVEPGRLAGLHQLRSAELFRLTHVMPPPTAGATVLRTIRCVPDEDLEPFLADALTGGLASVDEILEAAAARIVQRPSTGMLTAALRGAGTGQIRIGVEVWLARPATAALARTQVGTAVMFGVPGLEMPDLAVLQPAGVAAAELRAIRLNSEQDLRRALLRALPPDLLPTLIAGAKTAAELEPLLAALIGGGWTEAIAASLRAQGPIGLDGELGSVSSLLATLAVLDRDLAREWAESAGFDALVGRLPREFPWASTPVLEETAKGLLVRCDYMLVADGIQTDPHEDVVRLCETVLGLWPAADIAASDAVAPNGLPAGSSIIDIATKRIPRANLPPAFATRWNHQWREAIALSIATPTYSGYLAEAASMLDELAPELERMFDTVLRRRRITDDQEKRLGRLHERSRALTPPSQSPLAASGSGAAEPNLHVTKLQNLLFSATADLLRRFAPLPEGGGAYIGWLNELIRHCDRVRDEEPWGLLSGGLPQSLDRIRSVLVAVRSLAGEGHMRQERPVDTWRDAAKRARSGNALAACAAQARSASARRRQATLAELRGAVSHAGPNVELQLVDDPEGILPWPPYEALALVRGGDLVEALQALAVASSVVRAAVDRFVRVTVVPMVGPLALPQYALSGCETLLPLPERACLLLDALGIARLATPLTDAFNAAVANAGWLASMDVLRLGVGSRPSAEAEARESLEAALGDALADVERLAVPLDPQFAALLTEQVSQVRSGEIDVAGAAYDLLHGVALEGASQAIGGVGLMVLNTELQAALTALRSSGESGQSTAVRPSR